MRSLFLIALPRSLSTWVYRACLRSTGLREPAWTSDGEILNLDRHVLQGPEGPGGGARKFLGRERHAGEVAKTLTYLDALASPRGYLYKDVVQPFAVAEWARRQNEGCAFVRLERPLADIACAMWRHGWTYPAAAVLPSGNLRDDFLRGLLLAEAALATVDAPVLRYDDLIESPAPLEELLRAWYPEAAPIPPPDAFFLRKRDATLRRRESPEYRELASRLDELARPGSRVDAAAGGPPSSWTCRARNSRCTPEPLFKRATGSS